MKTAKELLELGAWALDGEFDKAFDWKFVRKASMPVIPFIYRCINKYQWGFYFYILRKTEKITDFTTPRIAALEKMTPEQREHWLSDDQ